MKKEPTPYFTNIMEYRNGTGPLNQIQIRLCNHDSSLCRWCCGRLSPRHESINGRAVQVWNKSIDNDTDGDMMPDFYEFHRGWNRINDNWSSFMKIQVQWIEVTPEIGNRTVLRWTDYRPQLIGHGSLTMLQTQAMLLRMRIMMGNGIVLVS